MRIANISDTARWMAYARALESERPDAIFHDPFSRRLAGEAGEAGEAGDGGEAGDAATEAAADGSDAADERLRLALTNDTATGVMRYADAGYEESFDEIARGDIKHFRLPPQ